MNFVYLSEKLFNFQTVPCELDWWVTFFFLFCNKFPYTPILKTLIYIASSRFPFFSRWNLFFISSKMKRLWYSWKWYSETNNLKSVYQWIFHKNKTKKNRCTVRPYGNFFFSLFRRQNAGKIFVFAILLGLQIIWNSFIVDGDDDKECFFIEKIFLFILSGRLITKKCT